MSSINTNLSAMTALQALKATQTAMNKNQGQISTGLRVGEASHNASYWSIATAMKSDKGALGAVKDSIGQSKAMINTFTSAMDKSLTYLNKMKEGLVAASQPGADLEKIQTEFKANIAGMKSAAGSASFNGQNWLEGDASLVNLVSSYDGVNNKVGTLGIDTSKSVLFKDASAGTGGLLGDVASIDITGVKPDPFTQVTAAVAGTTAAPAGTAHVIGLAITDFEDGNTIQFQVGDGSVRQFTFEGIEGADNAAKLADLKTKFDAFLTSAGITDVTAALDAGTPATKLQLTVANADEVKAGTKVAASFTVGKTAQALKTIDEAIARVTEGSAMLGANKALLETQEEFIGVLSDSLTAGVSSFVDADMNEASTRNQALQTQQQLGVQALSMANQNSQMILRLFQ
ncbi:flagellin [Microvirga guangxiensis]|uniref:Flagellin n=1 Tax=Microvirga guangxiensis TaxID=549386 RepID=A0A1G5CR89_9HYPH|nr:flagellin [Microvirga guangxiensis]SCY04884.1 flagellin [Microvirga guangxiensis]